MPTGHDLFPHYNANDPADLAEIVANGMVWVGPDEAQQLALDALVEGTLPLNDKVPPAIRAAVEKAQAAKEADSAKPTAG